MNFYIFGEADNRLSFGQSLCGFSELMHGKRLRFVMAYANGIIITSFGKISLSIQLHTVIRIIELHIECSLNSSQ